ncbi:hypothetical protein, variant [Cryptococcus amylolentus CBS 6039]|uniref:GST C-terminal domain-containing protein n=1 Tax=Cryptococcus amylolentus CBS 6039 TaxID=1295533 RepID=A0A1E3HNZ9_9TREE|nr:hypothetical protein, variant [Cryptococcus amylolentus CBS 6039]ODN78057.1 hypothetical protein, variant [Cryptococcus amylolentus CBS 6039]
MDNRVARMILDASRYFWVEWRQPRDRRFVSDLVHLALRQRAALPRAQPPRSRPDSRGKTPNGSKGLFDSDVLVEYVEDLYPASVEHPPVFPLDPYEKSWARLNLQHITKKIIPAYFKIIQAQDPSAQSVARGEFYTHLRTYTARIKEGGPYFAGEQWMTVDGSLAPFVGRFFLLEERRGFEGKEVGEKWVEYAKNILARESVKKTTSEAKYYTELMEKYFTDEANSQVSIAIRAGKALP